MGTTVIILLIIFGAIFGVFYLFFSTRNRERLALIEKGIDASIFKTKRLGTALIWRVLFLNIALLLIGTGAGILLAMSIQSIFGVTSEALYPGVIFIMAGVGLLTSFKITERLDKE